jgi:hypothetical protein
MIQFRGLRSGSMELMGILQSGLGLRMKEDLDGFLSCTMLDHAR